MVNNSHVTYGQLARRRRWYATITTDRTSPVWGRHVWGNIRPGLGPWNYPYLSIVTAPGLAWFRVLGWGLHYHNAATCLPALAKSGGRRAALRWGRRTLCPLWPRGFGGL